ncbi:hypothetical protein O181_068835 [Austropuccinia psidii MF-1]|uniref:Reverse transcriptase Ty1/copia-type domain-containing protein n=1 Tax=Austropuccinia psidii MF-1 TaxID=1389203 RepID=A0A9Q3I7G0_9BASI|nr:hypothetical protein [Austropuccinia psidii MF-1]
MQAGFHLSSTLLKTDSSLYRGHRAYKNQLSASSRSSYLVACTRPDLAYSAPCLAQFLSNPSSAHELAFRHVMRYLRGTSNWSLCLGCLGKNTTIVAYCDSDWGSNYDSKSFSGSCVFLYGLIGWKTTKQEVVALSSTEAEY